MNAMRALYATFFQPQPVGRPRGPETPIESS